MRQEVTGYEVRVEGERRDEHPRVYTHIGVEHVVPGRGLQPDAVRRAIGLSAAKYCSVSAMLEATAQLAISFRVIDTETGAEATGTIDVAAPLPAE